MGMWDMPARRVVTDTELRFNHRHDEKGRFASKDSLTNSAGGGTIDLSKRKTGYNRDSSGNFYIPFDSNGKPYKYPEYHLPKKEYARVSGGISTLYSSRYENKTFGEYPTVNKIYYFENHGFSEYNIYKVNKK